MSAPGTYRKIFVSLDGSEMQSRVLERACEIAASSGADLYVGHVIDSTPMQAAGTYPATLIPSLEKAWKESIEADVEKARAMPGVSSITVEAKAGRVRETLMDEFIKPQQHQIRHPRIHLDVPGAQLRLRRAHREVGPQHRDASPAGRPVRKDRAARSFWAADHLPRDTRLSSSSRSRQSGR